MPWCRKCRRFSKTFFVKRGRAERVSGSERAKHRTSLGKSTDVLFQKYGYLHRRSPMFLFSEKCSPFERCLLDPLRKHRHHVRMYIINNKILLHPGNMNAPRLVSSSNFSSFFLCSQSLFRQFGTDFGAWFWGIFPRHTERARPSG